MLVLATVKLRGAQPESCCLFHLFPTGQKGCSIAFEFDEVWDELPYRKAVFWAGDTIIYSGNITDSVEIPEEICKRPYVPLMVGVVGCDADPDEATLLRAQEITERLKAIDKEILSADSDTTAALTEERIALINEMKTLGLATKMLPSLWCNLGCILPGVVLPNTI